MDCRHINIFERGLDNFRSKPQAYIFLDKIPPSEYQDILNTLKSENMTLDNFTVSVSDPSGSDMLKLTEHRGRGRGYFGILELELRGALVDYDGKVLTLNTDFLPVCHCVLDDFAVSITDSSFVEKITLTEVVEYIEEHLDLKTTFKESPITKTDVFPNVTKYFTKKKDVNKFYKEIEKDERVTNILTGEVKLKDIEKDLKNSNVFK